MKVKFEYLKIKNFLSFEEAELKLNDLGYTIVNGINENPDDLAKSNGSGKSSLFDAINWCLTGETIRGTKDVVRLESGGNCAVELSLRVNNDNYVITRYKDPSNLKIYINGEDKSGKGIRDSEKLLEQYLPDLTPSLIGSVIILGQGLPQRFSNNTPAGRKEVLEKLSKSDFMIQDIKERLSTRKLFLSEQKRQFEDKILQLKTEESLLNEKVKTDEIKLGTMSDTLIETTLQTLRDSLNKENDLISNISNKLTENENNLSVMNKKLLTLTEDYHSNVGSIESNYIDTINELTSRSTSLKADERNLSAEITKLKSIVDVCPTCGQKLPNVHKVDTTDLELKLSSLREELSKTEDKLTLTKKSLTEDKNRLKEEFDKSSYTLSQEVHNAEVFVNKDKQEKMTHELTARDLTKDIVKFETELENFKQTKSNLEEEINSSKTKLVNINEKILYNSNELDNINNHIDVNSKMISLITRDFRGYLLTNVISFINNKSKEYSRELFETDKVDFVLDGNNIDIYYDSKPYECLSGGERQKIDVIVQLAIRDMLCTHLDFSSNILVLDEISDNIDSVGAEKLFNLISNKLTDVESVFIISHHTDYSLPIDNNITVVKGVDKISRIL